MTTKNIAVFCESWEQMEDYVINVEGFEVRLYNSDWGINIKNRNYYYMNNMSVHYIKGITWGGIIHLPDYQRQPSLLDVVMLNLKKRPTKPKKQQLIEELEQKLAELKKEEGL